MSKQIPEWISHLALDIYKIIDRYKAMSRFQEMLNIWVENHQTEIANEIAWGKERASHFEKNVATNDRLQDEQAGPPEDGWQFQGYVQHTDNGNNLIQGWVPPKLVTRPDIKRILPLSDDHELSLAEKYTVFAVIYEYSRKGTEQLPLWEEPDLTKQQTPEAMSDAKKCMSFEVLRLSIADLTPEDEGWLRIMLEDVEADVAEWAGGQSPDLKEEQTAKTVSETRTDKRIRRLKDHPSLSILYLIILGIIVLGTVAGSIYGIIRLYDRITEPAQKELRITPIDPNTGKTALNVRTRGRVEELRDFIIKEKIDPWLFRWHQSFKVTKHDGTFIEYSGLEYNDTISRIFLGKDYIDPFLEEGIQKVLDETGQECRANDIRAEEPLKEAAALLTGIIWNIYDRMAEVDSRLRKKRGDSEKASRVDLKNRIRAMDKKLREHLQATLVLYSGSSG